MPTPEQVRINKTTDRLTIHAPGDGSCLARIRAIMADLARQVGFPDHEITMIQMAVDEACANVVEHAYAPDKQWRWQHRQPEICMHIRTEHGRLVVEINDHGQRFDFTSYRPTDVAANLDEMKNGGYGVPIMRRFMDEVQYSSNNQTGNTLRLVKYLKKE